MVFFGISLPWFRIAGGLLLAGIGSAMLMAPPQLSEICGAAHAATRPKRDVSLYSLFIRRLSGPGPSPSPSA
jgi:small neutral amino acid transporter SnatA (MarC family)